MTSSFETFKCGDLVAMYTTRYSKPRFVVAISVEEWGHNGYRVVHWDEDVSYPWRVERCFLTFAGPGVVVDPPKWEDDGYQ